MPIRIFGSFIIPSKYKGLPIALLNKKPDLAVKGQKNG
jgi:hypothetical protein